MARHYLDHASASPIRPEARDALVDALDRFSSDPGRMHVEGMATRAALEDARDRVAAFLGARSREVVFTSCASEAIAAACHGVASRGGIQAVSAVEHSAVRLAASRHSEIATIGVDRFGHVDLDALSAALTPDATIVHVQWANHEVATRQPVAAVVEMAKERGVLVHVDAAQGMGHDPIAFDAMGIDLLSVSGPKFGAPQGTGALLIRRGLRIDPLVVGGDQERARRAGLENVAACVGFGATASRLTEEGAVEAEAARALAQSTRLAEALCAIEGVTRLGDPDDRVPHLVCVGIADVEPQAVLLGLDQLGVAAHSGSACATESLEPSPVLDAMGLDAAHSLRLSVGWSTTDADIDAAIEAVPNVLDRLRALRR